MPIHVIRDTIQSEVRTDALGRGYVTRRINIPEHMRNSIESIEVYNDQGSAWLRNDPELPEVVGYQLYVSPYPMQATLETWGPSAAELRTGGGAMAGDDCVLYKEQAMTNLGRFAEQQVNKIWSSRFPSEPLGSTLTNTWYSPHLYITCFVWNAPTTDVPVKFSLFIRTKQVKCNAVESSMGCYAEFLDAQARKLSEMGITYTTDAIAGYSFPMWKYAGIRPELMISGATALRYYNRVAANANQEMVSQPTLQGAFKDATTMVDFDAAFGDEALNLPEWITLMDVSGVTSGLIRPYPPPLKFADNGNTLMF